MRSLAAGCLVALALMTAPGLSFAQADGEAREAVGRALELARYRKYGEAITQLEATSSTCRVEGCDDATKASIYLALGTVYALDGKRDEAQQRFEWALALDFERAPDDQYRTRDVDTAFAQAKAAVEAGEGRPPPRPPGQLSDEQRQSLQTASDQLDGGDWEGCLQTMIVSTSLEEYGRGKLMLAKCQESGGLMLEARRDAEAAVEIASQDGDQKLLAEIQEYLEYLDEETPKIRLKIQSGIRNPVVKIDSTVVPPEEVKEPIPHNPGTAVVEVTGERGGQPYEFRQEIRFQRRELIELEVRSDVTPYQACLQKARTVTERQECERIFNQEEGLTVRGVLEVASYNDTDHVDVLSPSLSIDAVQPTEGWNVSGSVLVDVVTTASADIVTTASRRFDEVRFAAGLGGGYRIGPVTPSVLASVSVEPDYIGRTVGGAVSADVLDKMMTPYLGYSFGFDLIGRADTAWDVYSQDLYRHLITAGTSVVFNASTIGVVALSVQLEEGDQSKPYRHVAMFDGAIAPNMPRGATPRLVSAARLDLAPLEQLPLDRQRYALLLRLSHRLDEVTLRGSERVYLDSWGQWGSTTDARLYWDAYQAEGAEGGAGFPQLTLGLHGRFHIQGGASFWQRAYVGQLTAAGYALPRYRTGDRELGPLFTVTAGLGTRAALSEAVALGLTVEGLYSQFLDHLYLYEKLGLFTASMLEVQID